MNILWSIILIVCLSSCNTGYRKTYIVLTNNSSVALSDKAVAILRSSIPNNPQSQLSPLIISSQGDTIPAQLDDMNGDGMWDELFFVADLPAKGSAKYSLSWVKTKPEFKMKTSVRFGKRLSSTSPVKPASEETLTANELPKSLGYQKYQTDGPSWENDKVGFRHYLDGRNAKDFFGKKTSSISPENVGINKKGEVEDNYHVMEDWGRDVLSVANSLGIGGYGLMVGKKLLRLGVTADDSINNVETTNFKILDEGPVRSVLNFQYQHWTPEERNYSVQEFTSIWPGMYGYQNSVEFSGLWGDEELVVGLVNNRTDLSLTEIIANENML